MDITDLGFITAIVIGLTEVVKKAGLNSRYAPLVALLLGVGVSFLFAAVSKESVVTGIVAALSAMGLYSGTSATLRK